MKTAIIQDLLYNKPLHDVEAFLISCRESDILHIYAYNYNWNNGFEIPMVIIENPSCSLSTALMVFFLADGYRYLTEKHEASDIPEWLNFVSHLYNRIIIGSFTNSAIAFSVPLSKVQVFKLKKQLNKEEQVFVTLIDGENLDLSV